MGGRTDESRRKREGARVRRKRGSRWGTKLNKDDQVRERRREGERDVRWEGCAVGGQTGQRK